MKVCSFCFGLFLSVNALSAQTLSWETSYANALVESAKENKPLLLFFSGSDWSGWSMKMKREVLENPLFVEKVQNAFVFVEVDFPANQTLSQNVQEQNEQLKRQFHIQEYPRLLLVDEKERELARFGVETPEVLASELVELLNDKKCLEKALLALEQNPLTSAELEKLYNIALELKLVEEGEKFLKAGMMSSDPHFFLLEKYRLLAENNKSLESEALQIREKLIHLDPFNQRKTHLTLALIDFQARETSSYDRHDVIRPIEAYLDKFGEIDHENRWRLEMMVAQFYLNYDENIKALFHAEVAAKCVPEDRREEVEKTLGYSRKVAHLSMKSPENKVVSPVK